MLKLRVLTIVLLAPMAVAAILLAPSDVFAFLSMACIAVAAYEWAKLSGFSKSQSLVFPLCLSVFGYALFYMLPAGQLQFWVYSLAMLWWLFALLWVFMYQRSIFTADINRYLKLCFGVLALLPAWYAVAHLHRINMQGPSLVLYAFCIVWFADIGAYISGRLFGRTKLASNISPGKTWEGVAGGMLFVLILALAGLNYFEFKQEDAWLFVLVSMLAASISILGDLFESLLKRLAKVKDSGSLLPGHGGLLDRIDSITASAPLFVLAYLCLLT